MWRLDVTLRRVVMITTLLATAGVSTSFSQFIEVPVRSCALEGSAAAQNPFTDDILLARLRAVSALWLSNHTGISFQSALYPQPGSLDHLPKISDQCWNGGSCPGNPGDVFDSTGDFGGSLDELKVRMWACAFTWASEYPDASGILLVHIQRFVDQNGASTQTAGAAPYVPFRLWFRPEYCTSPRRLSAGDAGIWAFVAEDPSLGDVAQTAAHELGHDLLLPHGDGLDNDCNSWPSPPPAGCTSSLPPSPGPRLYDGLCDPNERDTGISLMSAANNNRTITAYQAETAAAAALLVPGVSIRPIVWANDAVSRTFLRTHTPNDIVSAQIAHDDQSHELLLILTLFGPLKPDPKMEYLFMADLDDNAHTGGAVSPLGIRTRFHGVDLFTRVHVKGSSDQPYPEAELWSFGKKGFLQISDSRLRVRFTRQTIEMSKSTLFDVVAIGTGVERSRKIVSATRFSGIQWTKELTRSPLGSMTQTPEPRLIS